MRYLFNVNVITSERNVYSIADFTSINFTLFALILSSPRLAEVKFYDSVERFRQSASIKTRRTREIIIPHTFGLAA